MEKRKVTKIVIEEIVDFRVREQLLEFWNGLQAWLASQDGNKLSIIEDGKEGCSCIAERKEAYQEGLRASLDFIRAYEKSRKGK